ncbi:MAG: hypothetical protein R2710_12755 [Acidimicrobiales bacterium]
MVPLPRPVHPDRPGLCVERGRSTDHPDRLRRYYLGTSAIFLGGWVLATIAGLVARSSPDSWHLGECTSTMFTGLVVMGLSRRPAVAAAIVGAAVSITIGLPNRRGLPIVGDGRGAAGWRSTCGSNGTGRASRDSAPPWRSFSWSAPSPTAMRAR